VERVAVGVMMMSADLAIISEPTDFSVGGPHMAYGKLDWPRGELCGTSEIRQNPSSIIIIIIFLFRYEEKTLVVGLLVEIQNSNLNNDG